MIINYLDEHINTEFIQYRIHNFRVFVGLCRTKWGKRGKMLFKDDTKRRCLRQ